MMHKVTTHELHYRFLYWDMLELAESPYTFTRALKNGNIDLMQKELDRLFKVMLREGFPFRRSALESKLYHQYMAQIDSC